MAVFDDVDRSRFGPYRVIRRIGSGGMGSIFEAEDTGLGHRVALKLLHPHVAERPGAASRFLREGRAAARVRHPNIVQVFALGTEGGTPYLAMELLDLGNVANLIARKGRLPVGDALELVLPVIAAVAAAHDAGVIHRDLKPSNVCLARGSLGRSWPKVVDFGVSKVVAAMGIKEGTVTETVIGTAAYMAPEQARAAANASFLSDQYSLGVLLYECITGALPFAGRSVYEILESVMSAPVAPPSARASDIPQALDDVVLRAMSREPHDRFPSLRAFGAALLPFASEQTRVSLAIELESRTPVDSCAAIARDVAPSALPAGLPTPFANTATNPIRRGRIRSATRSSLVVAAAALAIGIAGAVSLRRAIVESHVGETAARQPLSPRNTAPSPERRANATQSEATPRVSPAIAPSIVEQDLHGPNVPAPVAPPARPRRQRPASAPTRPPAPSEEPAPSTTLPPPPVASPPTGTPIERGYNGAAIVE